VLYRLECCGELCHEYFFTWITHSILINRRLGLAVIGVKGVRRLSIAFKLAHYFENGLLVGGWRCGRVTSSASLQKLEALQWKGKYTGGFQQTEIECASRIEVGFTG